MGIFSLVYDEDPTFSRHGAYAEDVFQTRGMSLANLSPGTPKSAGGLKLLRSVADGQVFDLIPEVAGRYLSGRNARHLFEVWKPNRQVRRIRKGYTLPIQIDAPFRLHWTSDEWHTVNDTPSVGTTLGIDFVDVPIPSEQRAPIQFTFFWMTNRSWEGRDYLVDVES